METRLPKIAAKAKGPRSANVEHGQPGDDRSGGGANAEVQPRRATRPLHRRDGLLELSAIHLRPSLNPEPSGLLVQGRPRFSLLDGQNDELGARIDLIARPPGVRSVERAALSVRAPRRSPASNRLARPEVMEILWGRSGDCSAAAAGTPSSAGVESGQRTIQSCSRGRPARPGGLR